MEKIEMLTKIYLALWLVLAAFAAGIFVTGKMRPTMVVFLGLIVFGMVFMGMMSVLPTAVHDELLKR